MSLPTLFALVGQHAIAYGFSNIGKTEPGHIASRDGTSIARPHLFDRFLSFDVRLEDTGVPRH